MRRERQIRVKELKNKFAAGMIAGVTAVLIGAGIAGYYLHDYCGISLVQTSSGAVYAGENEDGKDKEVVDDTLTQKLKLLEQCVDQYFLFDGADAQTYRDSIYKGFMAALDDPYSCYYTAEEYIQLMESTSGSYEGIGVVVTQNVQTKIITVVRPFEGCPGAEAGILPGDVIVEVDGEDISGQDLSTVVSKMKGQEGTTVELRIYRETEGAYFDFTVERRRIEVPTVASEMLEDGIGYIQVTEFDSVTADQFITAAESLKAQGMKALVVDIRDNPGGLLNIVVDMLDYMLPEGTVVYTEDKNGSRELYTSDGENSFDLPLAVLINGNSASASEIFAGAIQDYGTGTIVGTQSFGKGIVQSILPFNDGSAIKITVSRYFTPGGRCIHGEGITPDVEEELNEELKTKLKVTKEEDNQLQKALAVLREEMSQQE